MTDVAPEEVEALMETIDKAARTLWTKGERDLADDVSDAVACLHSLLLRAEEERDEARDYVAQLHGAKDFEQLADTEACILAVERERDAAQGQAENNRLAYEAKIQDLQRETLRTSALQKMLDSERQAVSELWERLAEYRTPEETKEAGES